VVLPDCVESDMSTKMRFSVFVEPFGGKFESRKIPFIISVKLSDNPIEELGRKSI